MAEIIRQRRRAGFVGRGAERAAFRGNFELSPRDERHRFLFHVHGDAGVGKTFLVKELEQVARECGAHTVYLDEAAGSVPEAMDALVAQLGRQGHRFKELERLLVTHRERRHEAEAASVATLEPEPDGPTTASMLLARAGIAGIGLVPGAGPLAQILDAHQLAEGTDRLRAGLSARLRSQDDVQLVLSPESVLTPVLLRELADAAADVPWLVFFFDTYERTAPFLDDWLRDVMTGDRYGAGLPGNVVVVTAGQRPFDLSRWGGLADFVTDLPLAPFTESEARGLLAGRGVVAEPVVEEVLRLTGGLPVLVSTLAGSRPADPADIGDPSATAVERFLKWEPDPLRRATALACALPRRLDADVFRAAVDCGEQEAAALFGWLRGLPFVSDRGDSVQYHDVVRAPMLRLQRRNSPRDWAQRHARLAETFGHWRTEAEVPLAATADELWGDSGWRALRLAESYHLLCARPRTALPSVLRDAVDACNWGDTPAQRWAQLLAEAGEDTDAPDLATWGRELLAALAAGGVVDALGLLLARAGLDTAGQAVARAVRGSALRDSGDYRRALAELDQALALDPLLARAHRSRGMTHGESGDHPAALRDLDRAHELDPDDARTLSVRGEYHRVLGHHEEALGDLDRAIALAPARDFAWASRGATHNSLGRYEQALADLDRALELNPDYAWALARRARVHRSLRDFERQLADLDRAVELRPESAWMACERGDALRGAGRHGEACADYDRALALDAEYASAYASRGVSRWRLLRLDDALADLDRALELNPDYPWALCQRAVLNWQLGEHESALADADRAVELRPDDAWIRTSRGRALTGLRRFEEARRDLDRALELDPRYAGALVLRGEVLFELGLYRESIDDYERFVDLGPYHGTDTSDLARLIDLVNDLRHRTPEPDDSRLTPLLSRAVEIRGRGQAAASGDPGVGGAAGTGPPIGPS
ncbi:tetratricopeptide repeat protein (plasmid) [Streptomyces sp. CWNU-52B]|uniref:tetratricopeptide repeat protein n=1 Tax=unclassified Streptomyces TaxID=2593676 RepID=UPI0039BFA7C0